ncbi:MAG: CinA family nicotinamide mononucleotide deamidase-related protein [Candidatus Tectimicrobiota bacterium]
MKAEIFAVGTELLMGELADSNSTWLAARLPALGIELQRASMLGDNLGLLSAGLSQALQRVDLVVTTGGLGPTQDDLTREAIAAALQETVTVQGDMLKDIERYFQQRGRDMPAPNIKQAHLIPSARFLRNPYGSAPGWWAERDGKIIVALPGPPAEMHPMWEEQVEPCLSQIATGNITIRRNIKTMGLSEAAVDERIAEFFGRENPYLGIYSKADGIHLRLIARAPDVAAARMLIAPVEAAIVQRLAAYVWGYDDETPEQAAGLLLSARGHTLATMEQGTGGYLANSITEVPNSGGYFKGGLVAPGPAIPATYGVPQAVLQQYGSVSQESAIAMAQAAREQLGADFGIGVTGIPGPAAVEQKPIGLAYFAIATAHGVQAQEMRVPPRRITLKRRVSNTALIELCKLLRAEGR